MKKAAKKGKCAGERRKEEEKKRKEERTAKTEAGERRDVVTAADAMTAANGSASAGCKCEGVRAVVVCCLYTRGWCASGDEEWRAQADRPSIGRHCQIETELISIESPAFYSACTCSSESGVNEPWGAHSSWKVPLTSNSPRGQAAEGEGRAEVEAHAHGAARGVRGEVGLRHGHVRARGP